MRYGIKVLLIFSVIAFNNYNAQSKTQLVILGSGNPNADPRHSGCSVAVVVEDQAYIIDFGPGIVRSAAALTPAYGGNIPALAAKKLNRAFLTHLHSDHTTGYPDLILTPWVLGRDEPLEVYGPEGLRKMTENILAAYKEDIDYRIYGLEPANNTGWRVNAHEISQGKIYEDKYVAIEAFRVEHGTWPTAFGFRFITPDKVIVISGDTAPSENLIEFAKGADILVHEVYYQKGFESKTEDWKAYHKSHHTSATELGEIAAKLNPQKLILYHTLYWGGSDEDILGEISEYYSGKVIVGRDGGIYD